MPATPRVRTPPSRQRRSTRRSRRRGRSARQSRGAEYHIGSQESAVKSQQSAVKDHLILVPGIDGTGKLFYRQVPSLEREFAVTTTRLRDDAVTMDELVADLHDEVTRVAGDSRRVT